MTPCVQSRCSSQLSYFPYWYFRAPDRNRTGTHICGEQDFKSCASTYFATRAFTITNIEIFFYISKFMSGKQDSNLRPLGPKPSILPDCTIPRYRRLTWNRTTNSCLEGDCYIHLTMSPNADRTRLELATSAVTGQHSNQLNYRSILSLVMESNLRPTDYKSVALPAELTRHFR